MPGTQEIIDLASVKTKMDLLIVLGRVLNLGGPNGNHPVTAVNAGSGWGMNWDALKDSLLSLDSGGIWGTSPKLEFPFFLEIINWKEYLAADPEGFSILKTILSETNATYAKEGLQFTFAFK
ncbi:MAG: barstar family protein [Nitrospirota bacterium]